MAYLDVRDGSLIAGDAFTTQMGVVAAGVFKLFFPFPVLSRGIASPLPKAQENFATSTPRA